MQNETEAFKVETVEGENVMTIQTPRRGIYKIWRYKRSRVYESIAKH